MCKGSILADIDRPTRPYNIASTTVQQVIVLHVVSDSQVIILSHARCARVSNMIIVWNSVITCHYATIHQCPYSTEEVEGFQSCKVFHNYGSEFNI
jgi:hypothetical protein